MLTRTLHQEPHLTVHFTLHRCSRRSSGFMSNLIAPNVRETDRGENMNAIDHPANLRFPVNRFENSASRRGCNYIVRDALGLHFWPRETGKFATDVKSDSVGHNN